MLSVPNPYVRACTYNVRTLYVHLPAGYLSVVQTRMPLPALPHARVVLLTRLHERGSDWLSILVTLQNTKKYFF